MCVPESQIVAIFSSRHDNLEDAANAGELYSVDIEYNMTLNDLSRLCEAIASAVGVPGGVKYGFINQPEVEEQA